MNHIVNSLQSTEQSSLVPDIPEEKTQFGMFKLFLHLILFNFIPAENDDFFRFFFFKKDLNEALPEKSGSACDKYGFVIPFHNPFPFIPFYHTSKLRRAQTLARNASILQVRIAVLQKENRFREGMSLNNYNSNDQDAR